MMATYPPAPEVDENIKPNDIDQCAEQQGYIKKPKYSPEKNIITTTLDEFMLKIYRIIDGKHDFEDGRSCLTAKQCNDYIITQQFYKTTIDANCTINKYLCKNGTEQKQLLCSGPLRVGAPTLHKFIDFEYGLHDQPFEFGQYIKVEVTGERIDSANSSTETIGSYCVERPFIGEYDISDLSRLIADRGMYGKRAIYKINFGDDNQHLMDNINNLNDIFKFNDSEYTIDATKIGKTELELIYNNKNTEAQLNELGNEKKQSQTGAGDTVDPATIQNQQTLIGTDNYNPYVIAGTHNNKYDTTLHFCFIRGKSLKLQLTNGNGINKGSINFKLIYNDILADFDFNLGKAPSVKDTSIYIRDKVIGTEGTNCFFSILSSIKKTIKKMKKNTYIEFFNQLLHNANAVCVGLNKEEIALVLISFKTIGDQIRSKDAQMLRGDLITLDNFLFDMVVAGNICRTVGEVMTGTKLTGLKIYESRDIVQVFNSLKESLLQYNKLPVNYNTPIISISIEDMNTYINEMSDILAGIQDQIIKTKLEEQQDQDEKDAQTIFEILDALKSIAEHTNTNDWLTQLTYDPPTPTGSGRRIVYPSNNDLKIKLKNQEEVQQGRIMVKYRILQLKQAYRQFIEIFIRYIGPIESKYTFLPLLKAVEDIYPKILDINIDEIDNLHEPPITDFIKIMNDFINIIVPHEIGEENNDINEIKDIKLKLNKAKNVDYLFRLHRKLIGNDVYNPNEDCIDYFMDVKGGTVFGGGVSDTYISELTERIMFLIKIYNDTKPTDPTDTTDPKDASDKPYLLYHILQGTTDIIDELMSINFIHYNDDDNTDIFERIWKEIQNDDKVKSFTTHFNPEKHDFVTNTYNKNLHNLQNEIISFINENLSKEDEDVLNTLYKKIYNGNIKYTPPPVLLVSPGAKGSITEPPPTQDPVDIGPNVPTGSIVPTDLFSSKSDDSQDDSQLSQDDSHKMDVTPPITTPSKTPSPSKTLSPIKTPPKTPPVKRSPSDDNSGSVSNDEPAYKKRKGGKKTKKRPMNKKTKQKKAKPHRKTKKVKKSKKTHKKTQKRKKLM
jgi:hypothetical protein